MTKWKCIVLGLVLSSSIFTGCGKKEDVITNLSYVTNAYTLEYDYFNSEKNYQFELKSGDELFIQLECQDGKIDLKVVDIDNEEIYHENLMISKDISVPIEKDGRYIVIMKGEETKGSIDITVK